MDKKKKLNILRMVLCENWLPKEIRTRLEDEVANLLNNQKPWSVS